MKKIFIAILLACVINVAAFAQENRERQMPAEAQALISLIEAEAELSAINKQLIKIEDSLKQNEVSFGKTFNYTKALNAAQDYALLKRTNKEEELTEASQQLSALGEAPADGAAEPVDIAKKREEINKMIDGYKTHIADADLMINKVDTLNNRILSLRNASLWNTLKVREQSIVNPKIFYDSLIGFTTFMVDILKSPWTWYYNLTASQKTDMRVHVLKMGMTMCLAVFIAVFVGIYIRRRFGYRGCLESPTYIQKVSAALWLFIARGLLPAGVLGAFIFWVNYYHLINSTPFGTFLKVFASYTLAIFLLQAIVKSIFAPKRGQAWRLIDVSDEKAKKLSYTLLFSIILICFVSFLQSMANRTDMTVEMEYAIKVIANLVKAACVILVASRCLYKNEQTNEASLNEEEYVSTSSKFGTLITLIMSATFVLSLFGYIRLSEFILNRFIFSIIFGGITFIVYKLIKVMLHQLLGLKYWQTSLHITRKLMRKIEFWVGFLIAPVFLFVATFFLLGIWGVSVDILLQSAKKLLTGFYIGDMKISFVSIFMGLGAFLVSLFIFKMIKNSLQSGNLSKIEMDPGIRNSFVAGIGFLGSIISVLIALVVMGGSLKGLTLIAGALSLGAGLGLQNVVSNFVSGIILLFERPIKIGDWVIIGGEEGIVKRINIRSTVLETWTKSDIIIPNATILSSNLINMTHDSKFGRVDIAIGVSYNSDIDLIKRVLLEIPLENKKVLKTPQPFVTFTDFGASSLDFRLSCYTSDITNRGGIATDLRERIFNRFKEENIEIPFPQQDIHIVGPVEMKK
ncbi:MAG: mechanosensitive ion channel family protein [Alphaproteobacteria bacterium]|nr:mechanosensitive ion channel family protein [Alphaproteobacteria bacterium]